MCMHASDNVLLCVFITHISSNAYDERQKKSIKNNNRIAMCPRMWRLRSSARVHWVCKWDEYEYRESHKLCSAWRTFCYAYQSSGKAKRDRIRRNRLIDAKRRVVAFASIHQNHCSGIKQKRFDWRYVPCTYKHTNHSTPHAHHAPLPERIWAKRANTDTCAQPQGKHMRIVYISSNQLGASTPQQSERRARRTVRSA